MKEKILVSACLAGEACRYDGASTPVPGIIEMVERGEAIPFCPECAGGLPTPRVPAERRGETVVNKDGEDVTHAYRVGAREALAICREHGIKCAILKAKSPSCGSGMIYDGSFSGTLVPGRGVTTEVLENAGIRVIDEALYEEEM